ncbi:MAG: hypothetical protein WCD59_23740, partial [Pseudolabrys sp.]
NRAAGRLFLRKTALSNCAAKSLLPSIIAVTASFGCSCGNAIPAARILVAREVAHSFFKS